MLLAGCLATAPPADISTTFERGVVRIGDNLRRRYKIDPEVSKAAAIRARDAGEHWNAAFTATELDQLTAATGPSDKLPVIVYAHGCAGIQFASRSHIDKLEALGDYVVVAPDSFARDRPWFCRSPTEINLSARGEVNALRRAELVYAVEAILGHPWADPERIFLIGHSQGGGTVLDYAGKARVRGRVSLNGGCFVRDPEGLGDGTRPAEAVLVFHSGDDPWFRRYPSDCPDIARKHPNGRLVLVEDDSGHDLIGRPEHFSVLKDWLREHAVR